MSFYRISDIRHSDVVGNTLSLGNIPIRVDASPFGVRLDLVDPNNAVPPTDPDGCDTPNFSLRTCDTTNAERLRSANASTRRTATALLIKHLGHRKALALIQHDEPLARSMAAFFGRFNAADIDAINLPARIRDRNANPFLPTSGDPDFRRANGKYRRFRRCDSHPRLLDSSWVGPAHRSAQETI